MLGSGVIDTGRYSLIAGTWGINAAVSKSLVENKAITQCCRFFGNAPYVCIDSAPTSCSNLEWFVHNILNDMPYDQVNRLVQQTPMDDNLFYLPYTANTTTPRKGKNGHTYGPRGAFCLETQHYPDSINHPEWPTCILHTGEKFKSTTTYSFF